MKPEVLMTEWTLYVCPNGHAHLHGTVHRHPGHESGRVTNGRPAWTSPIIQMGDGFAETKNTMYSLDGHRQERDVEHMCP